MEERINYFAADEDEKTEGLETEELETAVEGDDGEDEPAEDRRSDGQLLYEVLKKRQLVSDGEWDDLVLSLQKGWNKFADDASMNDIRDQMVDELS